MNTWTGYRFKASGKTEAKRVKQTFERQADATLVLHFSNGEQIETTKEHPFYVEHKGFTPAGELGIGTSIVTRAGPSVQLTRVEVKNAATTVYNFEVEDAHSYFVGQGALWVHNSCLTRDNHVYEIRNIRNGEVYKYGIGSKITNTGRSTRASGQVARLGADYEYRILARNLSRQSARSMERGRVNGYSIARQRAGAPGPVGPRGNSYPLPTM